jgi:hypothetical protein
VHNIQDHTLLFGFGNVGYILSLHRPSIHVTTDQALYPLFDLSLSLSLGGESDDMTRCVGLEARRMNDRMRFKVELIDGY